MAPELVTGPISTIAGPGARPHVVRLDDGDEEVAEG
jgi:hypothetical protein